MTGSRNARQTQSRLAKDSTANLGFEAKLWLAADNLLNNMDAAEYKHVVFGLIFLKYISDTFEEHCAKLLAGEGDYSGANPEDPDEYKAENVFWVPADARWSHLQASAKQPTIGKTVDDAMVPSSATTHASKASCPRTTPAVQGQRQLRMLQHFSRCHRPVEGRRSARTFRRQFKCPKANDLP